MKDRGLVIILNGPPGSGKDTIADYLEFISPTSPITTHRRMKDTLFIQALALSQIPEKEWFDRYEDRRLKEQPWDKLGGLSVREFMIKVSEEYVKPIFGEDFYGRQVSDVCKDAVASGESVVFSDGGFESEFDFIINTVGKENVILVQLYRDGCSFDSDSRNYLDDKKVTTIKVHNNGTIEDTMKYVISKLK